MSKSVDSPQGTILVLDEPKAITKKVKSAVTDSDTAVRFDVEAKPGVSNLLSLLSVATGAPDPRPRGRVRHVRLRHVQGRGRRRARRVPPPDARAVPGAGRRSGRARAPARGRRGPRERDRRRDDGAGPRRDRTAPGRRERRATTRPTRYERARHRTRVRPRRVLQRRGLRDRDDAARRGYRRAPRARREPRQGAVATSTARSSASSSASSCSPTTGCRTTRSFAQLRAVNTAVPRGATCVYLAVVAFLPFPTAIVGSNGDAPLAFILFACCARRRVDPRGRAVPLRAPRTTCCGSGPTRGRAPPRHRGRAAPAASCSCCRSRSRSSTRPWRTSPGS